MVVADVSTALAPDVTSQQPVAAAAVVVPCGGFCYVLGVSATLRIAQSGGIFVLYIV